MHDIDRTQLEHDIDRTQLESEAYESEFGEFGEFGETQPEAQEELESPVGESQEIELASEFLEISNEADSCRKPAWKWRGNRATRTR